MRDFLRPLLTDYREWVQTAWSAQTAHEGHAGAPGSPVGQCGVTSAWLQHRLNADHGIATQYCVGTVWISNKWTPEHVWLEIPDTYRTVVDLTADQFGLDPVVCDNRVTLNDAGVYYTAIRRLSAAEVAADPAHKRLAVLEGALS